MVPLFQILGPSLVPLLSKIGPLFGPSEGLFEGGTRLVITEDDSYEMTGMASWAGSKGLTLLLVLQIIRSNGNARSAMWTMPQPVFLSSSFQ